MVQRVVITDYYKNYSEHTNAVCGKYAESTVLNLAVYSNH